MATPSPAIFPVTDRAGGRPELVPAMVGRARRLGAALAVRFRRWREYRQTRAALELLDHRQLEEFGIHRRRPDLSGRKFP